jgi:hypothetical protein
VQGELVAVVPSKDLVLFTSSKSKAGLARMKATAERGFAGGSYAISKTLLVWRDGTWQEYRGE